MNKNRDNMTPKNWDRIKKIQITGTFTPSSCPSHMRKQEDGTYVSRPKPARSARRARLISHRTQKKVRVVETILANWIKDGTP